MISAAVTADARARALDLLQFIDASPSPWHAVAAMTARLRPAGFERLRETDRWCLQAGGRYYVVRDDSSLIAFVVGQKPLPESGFRIIGAHTDSPGLRITPKSAERAGLIARLGVEIYGGPILATFTDRDLSLAGRLTLETDAGGVDTRLLDFGRPLLRLPNLAIHMNRNVNESGLLLHKQNELPLLLAVLEETLSPEQHFRGLLAAAVGCDPAMIRSWELNVYDTQKGVLFGPREEFLANSQLDNLASCHAALTALLEPLSLAADSTCVGAFFDHEEVGSLSHKGADGSFLPDVLERISQSLAAVGEDYARARARSFMLSADMAHAWQPNFPAAYEPDHKAIVNAGPVIKVNANQRYTTEALSQTLFMRLCELERVPCQLYSHRSDLACGSTIGPMASARLGIRTVDVGNPMWAMHSIRESAGVLDHAYMTRVMARHFWDAAADLRALAD